MQLLQLVFIAINISVNNYASGKNDECQCHANANASGNINVNVTDKIMPMPMSVAKLLTTLMSMTKKC